MFAALNGAGEEVRVVGGAVRNALLGVPVHDVDLATTATPEEVVRRAGAAGLKSVPTGIAHGTVTLVSAGTPFEVTSLREDVETNGRHAVVRFGRDWARDAARRDFTLNALYADAEGRLYDPVGGLPDLLARRVRFIGDPGMRIREDHLRILRLFRFHAAYGNGPVDGPALLACVRQREGLDRLSRERVRAEMLKLVVAVGAPATLVEMSDAGLLGRILGGVADLPGFARLAALETALGLAPVAVRRLGGLAVRITEDAERLRDRLRLSNAEQARLLALTGAPMVSPDMPDGVARQVLYGVGAEVFLDRLLIAAARGGGDPAPLARMAADWQPPDCPITAGRLMAQGLKPGPMLGATLARARADWVSAGFPAEPDDIDRIIRATLTPAGEPGRADERDA
ncbi:poly(A) polymerase [Azorhizobium oxalatiphilum]|uniref:Poly(A) polymerase n=1 Tax=Azorhizobium oxalatiphilum TaxID=980631 RepID=A0A917F516_9HYPH|nr:poly(A) polymerase [Azorhizobium oxalatiphilum]